MGQYYDICIHKVRHRLHSSRNTQNSVTSAITVRLVTVGEHLIYAQVVAEIARLPTFHEQMYLSTFLLRLLKLLQM